MSGSKNNPDSTFNTRLEILSPDIGGVDTARALLVRLVSIDPSRPARATLELRDQTLEGVVEPVYFDYQPLAVEQDTLHFVGRKGADSVALRLVNTLSTSLEISLIFIDDDTSPFEIVETTPPTLWSDSSQSLSLKPGEAITVIIRFLTGEGAPI